NLEIKKEKDKVYYRAVVILAERFKDIIVKMILDFKKLDQDPPKFDDIENLILRIDDIENLILGIADIENLILRINKDILIKIFKSEIRRNKKLFSCYKHKNGKPTVEAGSKNENGDKLIDFAMTVAREIILNQNKQKQSNLEKPLEKNVFKLDKKYKPSNLEEALKIEELEFIELCKKYTGIDDQTKAISRQYKDIRLTQRHNYEIRHLLCGLGHDFIEIITEHDHRIITKNDIVRQLGSVHCEWED
ncbi:15628_t:CDS:2, partial [Cetraspora pellucida]